MLYPVDERGGTKKRESSSTATRKMHLAETRCANEKWKAYHKVEEKEK